MHLFLLMSLSFLFSMEYAASGMSYESCPCDNLYGTEYGSCVINKGSAFTAEVLGGMQPEGRTRFMQQLFKGDFFGFANQMPEEIWQKLRSKLSEEERSIWPKTTEELKERWKELDKKACDQWFFLMAGSLTLLPFTNVALLLYVADTTINVAQGKDPYFDRLVNSGCINSMVEKHFNYKK